MALKKETLEKIAAMLKVDTAKLTTAITDEGEHDIELPEVTIFTPDELTARDAAQKAEGKKDGMSEGKETGKELAIKDLKKAFGVEFEGKDFAKLTEAVKAQFAKGDDGLKEQVELLKSRLGEKDNEITRLNQATESIKMDATILAAFPKERAGILTDNEYLAVLKSAVQIESDNGKIIVKKDGQPLRDPKTTDALPLHDAIRTVFAERKWIEAAQGAPNGRGAGDYQPGDKPVKMSQLQSQWEKSGKNVASAEFQQEVMKLAKENADFEFDV